MERKRWLGIEFNVGFLPIILDIFFCKLSRADSPQHFTKDLEITKLFPSCIIRVINFRGLDIDFSNLSQPITLLRYFSFRNDLPLFPYEWSLQNFMSQTMQSKPRTPKNNTFSLDMKSSRRYIALTLRNKFQLKMKNMNSEANIYLHPPNSKHDKSTYLNTNSLGTILKDPFWIDIFLNLASKQTWKLDYMSTMPKYSLLICHKTQDSVCFDKSYKKEWISTVLANPGLVNLTETILILEVLSNRKILYALCIYCNPCNPFQMVYLSTTNSQLGSISFDEYVETDKRQVPNPYQIDVMLLHYIPQSRYLNGNDKRTRQGVFKYLNKFTSNEAAFMPFFVDVNVITNLVPQNSTFKLTGGYDVKMEMYKNIKIKACSRNKFVKYHPRLRLAIQVIQGKYTAMFQEIGLIFRKTQFRFISCHKEKSHWINQLKELVIAFDLPTWSLLIIFIVFISVLLKFIYKMKTKIARHQVFSTATACFDLVAAILDQSSGLFQNMILRNSRAFHICFAFIPLSFLALGNEYKGDNTTRLTLDTTLVPFDTFESLTNLKFT